MHQWAGLVFVAVLVAWLGSCSSNRVTHSEGKIEAAEGFQVGWEARGEDPHRTVEVTSDDPDLAGRRVCVQFRRDGSPCGDPLELTVPSTRVPVPVGVDRAEVCGSGCDEEKRGLGFPVPGLDRFLPGGRWEFFGMPLGAEGADYTRPQLTYAVEITAPRLSDAYRIRDRLLERGFLDPAPRGVEVTHFSYLWVDLERREVIVEVGETEPFLSIALDVNRTPYATIDDAITFHQNGWYIAWFAIPFGDPILHWDLTPGEHWNGCRVATCVDGAHGVKEVTMEGEWTFENLR